MLAIAEIQAIYWRTDSFLVAYLCWVVLFTSVHPFQTNYCLTYTQNYMYFYEDVKREIEIDRNNRGQGNNGGETEIEFLKLG